jgi:RimJ/RimL family protein N-acetyltransferase
MTKYKILNNQRFSSGNYAIVPIRKEDRYDIMKWRNEQMYHLRQSELLTKEKQDNYFDTVVSQLFEEDKPEQILFSYLEEGKCVGYGGLVHINWIDKHAEISFVLNSELEKNSFKFHWQTFLSLLKEVAKIELNLHKIYTYAFDLRPSLYDAIESSGFYREATLKNHCCYNDEFIDVVIHSKILKNFYSRKAEITDAKLLYDWVNEPTVRKNSLYSEEILWEQHLNWFYNKLLSSQTVLLIWIFDNKLVGQSRLDYREGYWLIDYSIDSHYRGKGFGSKIIEELMKNKKYSPLKAQVKPSNVGSTKVFQKLGFSEKNIFYENSELIEFSYR